jgi:hypothetical protein
VSKFKENIYHVEVAVDGLASHAWWIQAWRWNRIRGGIVKLLVGIASCVVVITEGCM